MRASVVIPHHPFCQIGPAHRTGRPHPKSQRQCNSYCETTNSWRLVASRQAGPVGLAIDLKFSKPLASDTLSRNKWFAQLRRCSAKSVDRTPRSFMDLWTSLLTELSHYELHRKPHETVTDSSAIAVSPRALHSELMCPICLDLMKNTLTTKEVRLVRFYCQ